MYRGVDENKDQSYFLAMVSHDALKDILFPLGNLEKTDVRALAEEIHLNVAKKKDSTGICFIGERHFQAFLENYLKPNPGDILNVETMEKIGRHTGLMNYTIGQRRNVGISGSLMRHYVCGKDVKKIFYMSLLETVIIYIVMPVWLKTFILLVIKDLWNVVLNFVIEEKIIQFF